MTTTAYLNQPLGTEADEITAAQFVAAWPADADVILSMCCPGGLVYMGLEIANFIKLKRASGVRVLCRIGGICGSVATLIALACDRVEAMPMSMWLAHESYMDVKEARVDDLRAAEGELSRLNEMMLQAYCEKTGKGATEMAEIMKRNTPMSAQEALDAGFIDSVTAISFRAVARYAPGAEKPSVYLTSEPTETKENKPMEDDKKESKEEVAAVPVATKKEEPKAETVTETEEKPGEEAKEVAAFEEIKKKMEELLKDHEALKADYAAAKAENDLMKTAASAKAPDVAPEVKAKATGMPAPRAHYSPPVGKSAPAAGRNMSVI